MRYIAKGIEPPTLGHTRAALKRTPGLHCDLYAHHLNADSRQDILEYCLREQQGLCAYTGMDASDGKGHVEHLVPCSVSCPSNPPVDFVQRPYETIAWDNLVACFPANPSGWPYGAGRKGNWPSDTENARFVSPLHPSCETRFRYGKQGTVQPMDINDEAAKETIRRLELNHDYLIDARKAILEVDRRTKDPAQRRKLLAHLEDRAVLHASEFAFQRSQVLRRLWAGAV